jgi:hypothetical protein
VQTWWEPRKKKHVTERKRQVQKEQQSSTFSPIYLWGIDSPIPVYLDDSRLMTTTAWQHNSTLAVARIKKCSALVLTLTHFSHRELEKDIIIYDAMVERGQ